MTTLVKVSSQSLYLQRLLSGHRGVVVYAARLPLHTISKSNRDSGYLWHQTVRYVDLYDVSNRYSVFNPFVMH